MCPQYEYCCTECQVILERMSSIHNRDKDIECPRCGGEAKKIISQSSFKINGYCEANGYSKPRN